MNKERVYSKIVALTFEEDEVEYKPYVRFGENYGKWVTLTKTGLWMFMYDDSVPAAPTLEELCTNYLVFWDPIANGRRGL